MDAHPKVPTFLLARPGSPGMPSIATATHLTKAQKKARDAAEKFESVFIEQMLQQMFKGIKTNGMFDGGNAEKVYRSMLNQYYAEAISKRGGIGIADAVYSEILKLQKQHNPRAVDATVQAQAQSLINAQIQGQAETQELNNVGK